MTCLKKLNSVMTIKEVSQWKYTRFPVKHNDAVDPHGYKFTTPNGGILIHSGDSGPCNSLYENIEDDCLFILEMGVPEWVPSEEHHKPSHITSISEKHPNVKFAITHTFVDMDSAYQETVTSILPNILKMLFIPKMEIFGNSRISGEKTLRKGVIF